jgi:hypothetical protein
VVDPRYAVEHGSVECRYRRRQTRADPVQIIRAAALAGHRREQDLDLGEAAGVPQGRRKWVVRPQVGGDTSCRGVQEGGALKGGEDAEVLTLAPDPIALVQQTHAEALRGLEPHSACALGVSLGRQLRCDAACHAR